jgi:hypothetical protein
MKIHMRWRYTRDEDTQEMKMHMRWRYTRDDDTHEIEIHKSRKRVGIKREVKREFKGRG